MIHALGRRMLKTPEQIIEEAEELHRTHVSDADAAHNHEPPAPEQPGHFTLSDGCVLPHGGEPSHTLDSDPAGAGASPSGGQTTQSGRDGHAASLSEDGLVDLSSAPHQSGVVPEAHYGDARLGFEYSESSDTDDIMEPPGGAILHRGAEACDFPESSALAAGNRSLRPGCSKASGSRHRKRVARDPADGSAPTVSAPGVSADTGSAGDLVPRSLVNKYPHRVAQCGEEIALSTAKGLQPALQGVRIKRGPREPPASALILKKNPAVISVGQRVAKDGWEFTWPPYSDAQTSRRPDASLLWFRIQNYVPYLPDHRNASVASVSESDPYRRALPAPAPQDSGPPGADLHDPQAGGGQNAGGGQGGGDAGGADDGSPADQPRRRDLVKEL